MGQLKTMKAGIAKMDDDTLTREIAFAELSVDENWNATSLWLELLRAEKASR